MAINHQGTPARPCGWDFSTDWQREQAQEGVCADQRSKFHLGSVSWGIFLSLRGCLSRFTPTALGQAFLFSPGSVTLSSPACPICFLEAGDIFVSHGGFPGRSQLLACHKSIFPVGLCLPLRQCPASNHVSQVTILCQQKKTSFTPHGAKGEVTAG